MGSRGIVSTCLRKSYLWPSVDYPETGSAVADRHARVICNIGGKRYALDFWSRASEIQPVAAEVLPFPPRRPQGK